MLQYRTHSSFSIGYKLLVVETKQKWEQRFGNMEQEYGAKLRSKNVWSIKGSTIGSKNRSKTPICTLSPKYWIIGMPENK